MIPKAFEFIKVSRFRIVASAQHRIIDVEDVTIVGGITIVVVCIVGVEGITIATSVVWLGAIQSVGKNQFSTVGFPFHQIVAAL